MPDFVVTQGNRDPAVTAVLAYADGTPANLAGATVQMVLRNPEATAVYLTGDCTVADDQQTVTYDWAAGDTATPGDYVGEFVVTFVDGTQQSFPTEGYFSLTITPSLTGSVKPRPTYLTTLDWVEQTRLYLDGKTKANRNKLASAIDASAETLTLKYDLTGATAGMTLTIGLETLYVWEAAGKSLTVERGADGTVASQHAAGDVILVDPEFTDARILDALNLELLALPTQGVYPVKSLDLSPSCKAGYDLAADVVKVLDVRWQNPCDSTRWTAVESFEVARDMPVADFPSGVALLLPDLAARGAALRVRYRTVLGTLSTLYDNALDITSLPESAQDIPPMGAALRLMDGRAIQRVSTVAQPDPRDAAEVTVTAVLNAAARLKQDHDARVQDEADKLSGEWVWRKPARALTPGVRRWARWR